MANIKFGTGGMPLTSKTRSAVNGITRIHELGLDAMELEFVYQIFVKESEREEVKKIAEEKNVSLTVHGSYFINLASLEEEKIDASIKRIVDGAKAGEGCGAKSITFHSGTFMKRDAADVFDQVKIAFERIFDEYKKLNLSIKISPELTGKASQFGDLEDLIRLVELFPDNNLAFCIDFAHKHARDGGGWNSYEEFSEIFETIEKRLGQEFLKNMHMHVSGINYTSKGERNHLTFLSSQKEYQKTGINVGDLSKEYNEMEKKCRLEKPDFKWQELIQSLYDNNVGGILICESPNLEEDALLMKKYYESLK